MNIPIVFCHLLNDRSGSPSVLRSTIEATQNSETSFLFIGSSGNEKFDYENLNVIKYFYPRGNGHIFNMMSYFLSQFYLYRALSREKNIPDNAIIFVNTLLPFGAMIWAKIRKRIVIVHVHESSIKPKLRQYFLLFIAKYCVNHFIYVSNDQLQRLPINKNKSSVIFNPVDRKIFNSGRQKKSNLSDKFRILMLCSFRKYKGVFEFIELASRLKYRNDIIFDLVLNEDDEYVESLRTRYRDILNLNIHFRTSKPSIYYERASLVVNLSRVDEVIETFGLTLVEAMTFGLPVIAPPIGGPSEIVDPGVDGFCVDSRNVETLITIILDLVDDRNKYRHMSNAAMIKSKLFSLSKFKHEICFLIKALYDK